VLLPSINQSHYCRKKVISFVLAISSHYYCYRYCHHPEFSPLDTETNSRPNKSIHLMHSVIFIHQLQNRFLLLQKWLSAASQSIESTAASIWQAVPIEVMPSNHRLEAKSINAPVIVVATRYYWRCRHVASIRQAAPNKALPSNCHLAATTIIAPAIAEAARCYWRCRHAASIWSSINRGNAIEKSINAATIAIAVRCYWHC